MPTLPINPPARLDLATSVSANSRSSLPLFGTGKPWAPGDRPITLQGELQKIRKPSFQAADLNPDGRRALAELFRIAGLPNPPFIADPSASELLDRPTLNGLMEAIALCAGGLRVFKAAMVYRKQPVLLLHELQKKYQKDGPCHLQAWAREMPERCAMFNYIAWAAQIPLDAAGDKSSGDVFATLMFGCRDAASFSHYVSFVLPVLVAYAEGGRHTFNNALQQAALASQTIGICHVPWLDAFDRIVATAAAAAAHRGPDVAPGADVIDLTSPRPAKRSLHEMAVIAPAAELAAPSANRPIAPLPQRPLFQFGETPDNAVAGPSRGKPARRAPEQPHRVVRFEGDASVANGVVEGQQTVAEDRCELHLNGLAVACDTALMLALFSEDWGPVIGRGRTSIRIEKTEFEAEAEALLVLLIGLRANRVMQLTQLQRAVVAANDSFDGYLNGRSVTTPTKLLLEMVLNHESGRPTTSRFIYENFQVECLGLTRRDLYLTSEQEARARYFRGSIEGQHLTCTLFAVQSMLSSHCRNEDPRMPVNLVWNGVEVSVNRSAMRAHMAQLRQDRLHRELGAKSAKALGKQRESHLLPEHATNELAERLPIFECQWDAPGPGFLSFSTTMRVFSDLVDPKGRYRSNLEGPYTLLVNGTPSEQLSLAQISDLVRDPWSERKVTQAGLVFEGAKVNIHLLQQTSSARGREDEIELTVAGMPSKASVQDFRALAHPRLDNTATFTGKVNGHFLNGIKPGLLRGLFKPVSPGSLWSKSMITLQIDNDNISLAPPLASQILRMPRK